MRWGQAQARVAGGLKEGLLSSHGIPRPMHAPITPPITAASCRRIYGLSRNDEVSLTFGCKVPSVGAGFGGGDITLEGSSSFSAAVELASISAGERMRRQQEQQEQQQQLGAAAGAATAGVTGEARQSGGGVLGSAMRRLFR